jgi:hypothetical protein
MISFSQAHKGCKGCRKAFPFYGINGELRLANICKSLLLIIGIQR